MKRISIKGKGVDAWFGGGSEGSAPPSAPKEKELLASQHADQPASKPANQPAGEQTSLPASKLARATLPPPSEAPQQAEPVAPIQGNRRRLRELVFREHPVAGTFRFTQDELDAIRDIRYELDVKRGVKVTGNDIIRLGLNNVIDDYRERGDSSLLLDVFKEELRRGIE